MAEEKVNMLSRVVHTTKKALQGAKVLQISTEISLNGKNM